MSVHVLAGLLDEKLIRILSLFLRFPDKEFSLTEVCKLSRVNNATTFRTLNKLVSEELVETIPVGKVKNYKMATGERAQALAKLLKRDESADPIGFFCREAEKISKVKTIILDLKSADTAKLIIVVDSLVKHKLEKIAQEVKRKYRFHLDFAELKTAKYEELKKTNLFDTSKKILFEYKKA